jgi:hypothetical protein
MDSAVLFDFKRPDCKLVRGIASEHREPVCGMNPALIEGLLAGTELPNLTPVLDPRPHECCVAVTAAASG